MTAQGEGNKDNSSGDRPLDVVVVGGSQAGLAMAWHLARQGLRFLVLEAGPERGHTWRSRWDSLKLFTPAQYDAMQRGYEALSSGEALYEEIDAEQGPGPTSTSRNTCGALS